MKNRTPAVWLLVLLFHSSTFAQAPPLPPNVDSLKQLIPRLTDSLYARNLLDISKYHLMYVETDSARKYLEMAQRALDKLDYPTMQAGTWNMLGTLESFERNMGESLYWLKKALKSFEDQGDLRGISSVCTSLGRTYFILNDHPNSLKMHLRALEIDQELHDNRGIFIGNHNISTVLSRIEEPRKSISYELRALRTPDYRADTIDLIPVYMGMAADYRSLALYDSSIYYSRTALEHAYQIQHKEFQMRILEGMIHTFIKKEAYQPALYYLQQLEPLIDTADYMHHGLYHNYLASALFGEKHYDHAIENAMISLDYAHKLDELIPYNNAYFQLYTFYKELGPAEKALAYYEKYLDAQDSIYQKEKMDEVKRLELSFQVREKEENIQQMKEESKWNEKQIQRKNRWIALLGLGMLILMGLLVLFYRNKILQERLKKGLTEQRLLRTQMNPHFFFHALGTIQQFILQEKNPKDSLLYLSKFARLMRNTLESSQTELIPLTQEIESLENYVQLQQLRHNFSFDYHIAIDQNLNPKIYQIPPMLIQPVVENAIEHGLVRKQGKGKLTLNFHQIRDSLEITIEDNGVGRHSLGRERSQKNHNSLATQLIQERLDLLRKNLREVAQMNTIDLKDITGTPLGTRVIFHLPLQMSK